MQRGGGQVATGNSPSMNTKVITYQMPQDFELN